MLLYPPQPFAILLLFLPLHHRAARGHPARIKPPVLCKWKRSLRWGWMQIWESSSNEAMPSIISFPPWPGLKCRTPRALRGAPELCRRSWRAPLLPCIVPCQARARAGAEETSSQRCPSHIWTQQRKKEKEIQVLSLKTWWEHQAKRSCCAWDAGGIPAQPLHFISNAFSGRVCVCRGANAPRVLGTALEGRSKLFWEARSLWELWPFLEICPICWHRSRSPATKLVPRHKLPSLFRGRRRTRPQTGRAKQSFCFPKAAPTLPATLLQVHQHQLGAVRAARC